jgi:membrane associated rhomboid family serine protease
MPVPIAVLMGLTIVASIAGAICERNGIPLVSLGILLPPLVWKGEAWRLVTWVFYEMHPLSLVFACFMLYWFGRDLCERWGARKFLAIYFGFAALVAGLTVLIGKFVWHEVWLTSHLGHWPIMVGLMVGWASLFPERQLNTFFVQLSGRVLVYVVIGGTVLFSLFFGFASFVPHFLAEFMMLAYAGQLRRWFLKWRLGRLQKQAKRYVDNVERIDREEDDAGPPPRGKPPKYLN